jgi:hypothetical protein
VPDAVLAESGPVPWGEPARPGAATAPTPDRPLGALEEGGLRAVTGVADEGRLPAGELTSAVGIARADFHGLLLDLTNVALRQLNDEAQKQRVAAALEALEPEIERRRREHPENGVLLIPVYRRRSDPTGFSAITPTGRLLFIKIQEVVTAARPWRGPP